MTLLNEITRSKLDRVLSAEEECFDRLLEIAGLDPLAELRFADLRGVDFNGSHLNGWDFTGADLQGASFRGAYVSNCVFTDALGVDLTGAIENEETKTEFDQTAQRAIWEFCAGRAVLISSAKESLLSMPADGLDSVRLAAFRRLIGRTIPQLVITGERPAALGLKTSGPTVISLTRSDDVRSIQALLKDAKPGRKAKGVAAAPTATAAIELTKLAKRLPAVIVAKANAKKIASADPSLISVQAEAVIEFSRTAFLMAWTIA